MTKKQHMRMQRDFAAALNEIYPLGLDETWGDFDRHDKGYGFDVPLGNMSIQHESLRRFLAIAEMYGAHFDISVETKRGHVIHVTKLHKRHGTQVER